MGDAATGQETTRTGTVGAEMPDGRRAAGFSCILACVDGSPHAAEVLAWATAIARRLNASLQALRVLDMPKDQAAPQDPIAWDLRRRQAQRRLEDLLDQTGAGAVCGAGCEVAMGRFHERLQAVLAGGAVDLCVIGSVGESTHPGQSIGDTARRIVETARCSVLIVPPRSAGDSGRGAPEVRRLMVPLDCSRRAETALPAAIAIADAFGSEVVMAHAVPEPAITEVGPPEEAEVALRSNFVEHNRKAAERYMSRLRARMALDRRPIRTLIVSGADPRHRLLSAAADETADLIVLAAKGAGGYADQALGSVTEFLVTHLGKPILIVRPESGRKPSSVATTAAAATASGNLIRGRA
jgi:nucleotide-binding universal stress UspA family protein